MKRTKPKKQQLPENNHTCGECMRGEPILRHIDIDTTGKPFMKVCQYSKYATNDRGEQVCLRSTKACDKFKPV